MFLRSADALKAYADVEWRGCRVYGGGGANSAGSMLAEAAPKAELVDPNMAAWIEAVAALPGKPGCFPSDWLDGNHDGKVGGRDRERSGGEHEDMGPSAAALFDLWDLRDLTGAEAFRRARVHISGE